MTHQFSGGDVNAVLRFVLELEPHNGDVQLSLLTYALVTACKSCGIDRETVIEAVGNAYDDDREILRLDHPATRAAT